MRKPLRTAAVWAVAGATAACGGGGGASSPASNNVNAAPNLPPRVSNSLPDRDVLAGHLLDLDVTQGGTTFTDPDGDALTYTIQVAGGRPSYGLVGTGTRITGRPTGAGWTIFNVTARDPHGNSESDTFEVRISPNSAPVVVNANVDRLVSIGTQIDIDVTQGGAAFADADGDSLTYDVTLMSDGRGVAISGTRVMGAINSVGLVRIEVVADDGAGGRVSDGFSIAVAGPLPGTPTLPAVPYVYADEALPLPYKFRYSSENAGGSHFWDTQPGDNRTTDAGAALGRVLFYDKRLSITNTVACGSCHHQANGFAAPERFSAGVQGVPSKRNAMGLTNVRYNIGGRFFSDLRVGTLEELAAMPIEDSTELGQPLAMAVEKLAATEFYPPLFEAAFGTREVTADRITRALAQFLRALISYRSKFDRAHHVMTSSERPQPETVLSPQELRGAEIFTTFPAKCEQCHVNDVHTMPTASNNGLDMVPTDLGAGDGRFRSASLRNIAVTAPYMHDGRFATLREVIDHYDHGVQDSEFTANILRLAPDTPPRRLNLSEQDKLALEAFLNTLTDEDFLQDPRFSDPFN
jgi:cytochrome c peroxidase